MSKISNLIMSLMPEDGSSISNGAMMTRLCNHNTNITEDAYEAAREALIEDVILGRGKGRGGRIYRIDVTDMEITTPMAKDQKGSKGKRMKSSRKSDKPSEVLSYRHNETQVTPR
ncbi:MAG: hypothetical protein OXE78_11680 [Gammaproteobacteria bacterium]|nr:hypothetical protein [Gammaproteobacteria bacterium]